jgi:hypothetical protein
MRSRRSLIAGAAGADACVSSPSIERTVIMNLAMTVLALDFVNYHANVGRCKSRRGENVTIFPIQFSRRRGDSHCCAAAISGGSLFR